MSKDKKKKDKENIKILTLGNGAVGKTCFIIKFTDDYFNENTLQTTGIDFQTKIIKMNEKTYNVNFYDTAGQERYKSLSLNLFKNTDGILLMYDVTERKTFDAIPQWIEGIEENEGSHFPIILVGNKCDLNDERQVPIEEGQELAKKYNFDFFETSNKEGTNINEVGMALINKIIAIREKRKEIEIEKEKETTLKLEKEKHKKKKILFCCPL